MSSVLNQFKFYSDELEVIWHKSQINTFNSHSGAKIGSISASLQTHIHTHTNASEHNLELNCAMTKTHAGEYTSVA